MPIAAQSNRRRRAFTLVEVLVGSMIALVGAGAYILLQTQQARQDRDVDQRLSALCEARSVLEAQRSRPFVELALSAAPLPVGPLALPPVPGQGAPRSAFWELPDAAMRCQVKPYSGGPAVAAGAVEIEVEARWTADGSPRKLTLVTVRADAWPLEEP